MSKTFIMGDIHGEYKKLISCLKQVNFNYDTDRLIQLGDVCDRGPASYLVVEELLKIHNLIAIKGNHDDTFYQSIITGNNNLLFNQGGKETLESYIKHCNPDKSYAYNEIRDKYETDFDLDDYPQSHIQFFKKQLHYYIDKNNNCFVHGGFNRHEYIETQPVYNLIWDRDLWLAARSYGQMINNTHKFKMKDNFNEVFIGHTPTTYYNSTIPLKAANIWNLDTGCGKNEKDKLTLMNLETKEFVQA